jgi:hypothetical protein
VVRFLRDDNKKEYQARPVYREYRFVKLMGFNPLVINDPIFKVFV